MSRTIKFLSMDELKVGMHVQLTNRYSSEIQNGLVVKVITSDRGIMVDGKPVQKRKNTEVTIARECDEDLILSTENYANYSIVKL